MSAMRLNNHIRTLRFFHGEMTQQALAEKVGVTRQTILSLEKGKYSPSLELAFKIAQVFDEPIGKIFSYEPAGEASKPPYDWESYNNID
jgi:putative transcriptional regulator